jgi:DNA repair protein RadC
METVPVYRCKLVRETTELLPATLIENPNAVVAAARAMLEDRDRECVLVMFLTARHQLCGMSIVSVGDVDSALMHPREVFKCAILASAVKIAVAHNHPSGDPSPSPADMQVTKRLQEAGKLLGIELMDHVIIGAGRHCSLLERGLIA